MGKQTVIPNITSRSEVSVESIDAIAEFADGLYELQRMCGGTVPKHPSYEADHGVQYEAKTLSVEYDSDNPEAVVQAIKSRLNPDDGTAWADTYNTALSIITSRFESTP